MKKVVECKLGELCVGELEEACSAIVQLVQQQSFSEDLKSISNKSKLHQLRKLSPILLNRTLRVGGRVSQAPIPFEAKHQMILPCKHPVTDLIIHHHHSNVVGHLGTNTVLAAVRKTFWIVKGNAAVRRVVRHCLPCQKNNTSPGEQMMADLPLVRLTPDVPPFTNIGIDYFGPLHVKQGRKNFKRYGCIFTCLSIRAVHIEIAHSLSEDSFLCAFQRFVSRRGRPEHVFSDNGTNFKADEQELRTSIQTWNQHKVIDYLHQKGIEWHFNPPAASHMGGVWERLIRSVKNILKAFLKKQLLADEALTTLMTEVELIMNDRPLTTASDNVNGVQPLTPNKLLLLRTNASYPPGTFSKDKLYTGRWWRQIHYLANVFWKRWISEFLPTLQIRQKWLVPRVSFKVGDVVLIKDERLPRGEWPLGVVTEVHPDRNGYVRSVRLFSRGFYKVRPITKIYLLEGASQPSTCRPNELDANDNNTDKNA